MATIAVLGTGLLGSGMVRNLMAKGHAVRAWNRSADKLAPLAAEGAYAAADPGDAARGADRVHLVLTADDAVESVLAAALPGIGDGVPVLDHSTNLPARVAARSTDLRGRGVRYLHAPVFMGPQNARDGTGLMLVAGPTAEVEALTPGLSEMTGKVWHVGERADLAAIHKLSGNALLVSLSGTLGDILSMGEANGLDAAQTLAVFDVFKPGAAVGAFGARVAAAGTSPASFELSMARKDVRLMIEASGGDDGLVVFPALAAAMDAALADGQGDRDFAIFARPRARR